MSDTISNRGTGILTYGSVELCLYKQYRNGEILQVRDNLYLEVVDLVEKADGVIVLGMVPNHERERSSKRPACLCVLFTHYYRNQFIDAVDHAATVNKLTLPTETIRLATERAFLTDLVKRSVTASLAYNPSVRYLG